MNNLFKRMLARYDEAEYVIRLKTGFLLRVCLGGIIVLPIVIIYSIYLQMHNPAKGYSVYLPGIAPLLIAFLAFIIITLLLIRGYHSLGAHCFFITALGVVWAVMFVDTNTPVARLDTVAVGIAILSMVPLIIRRRAILIPIYSAATIIIVFVFAQTHAAQMKLSHSDMWDFIADTWTSVVIIAIVAYNLFAINRLALSHSEESRNKLERTNEELSATNQELEATNEELGATNEELEAAMEELSATNEEYEAQNHELLASKEIISEALEEKTVLIKEVHHRVKNNMQIVSSLLNLQSLNITDPVLRETIKDAISRIHSMALIHEKIYKADNFSRINMAAYITDLANEIIQLYSPTPDAIRVETHMEAIYLPVDQAVPCGILINEILTNSIKHGSRDTGACLIDLSMKATDGMVTMTIADSGPGMDRELFDKGSTKTLGLQIIEALALQLNADLALDVEKGTRFTIRFPDKPV